LRASDVIRYREATASKVFGVVDLFLFEIHPSTSINFIRMSSSNTDNPGLVTGHAKL
jgi:hypothetical protein